MKTMAIGAAAAAAVLLLAGASPAAAQKPDQDALCFIATSAFFGQISSGKANVPPEMAEQVKVSMGYYGGRLTGRFPAARLNTELRTARSAAFAMPAEEQRTLLANCLAGFQTQLRTLIDASKEK